MRFDTNDPEPHTYYQRAESWGDFLKYARERPSATDAKDHSRQRDTGGWAGTDTIEEAIDIARDGWKEGETLARGYSLTLVDMLSSLIERPVHIYDVEGHGIDVARYVDGEPECWLRQDVRVTEGPGRRIVRIVLNISVSSGVSTEVMKKRGAIVAALVELLEHAGHGVEVTTAAATGLRHRNQRVVTYVPVKAADQPLDMARTIFALAHPAMFRRLIFAVWEGAPDDVRRKVNVTPDGAYGAPISLEPSEERGEIYIDRGHLEDHHTTSPAAARAWIVDQLKRQGVTLREE